MSETNLSWDDLRLFLAVARHGGLAGASGDTEKSAPTLGRRVLALERQLGMDLFDRSVRGYELTVAGTELFEKVIALEKNVEPILQIAGSASLPRVKVSAGVWVTHFLCSRLIDFEAINSAGIQFISTNQTLDITHREAVIGIRNSEPTHPNLARQPIRQVDFAVYATDKNCDTWAQVVGSTPSAQWLKTQTSGERTVEVTDPRSAMDITLTGLTKTVLPTFIGDNQPPLIRLADTIKELQHQQWLVTHQDDRNRPEVRQVVNWIKTVLGDETVLR